MDNCNNNNEEEENESVVSYEDVNDFSFEHVTCTTEG